MTVTHDTTRGYCHGGRRERTGRSTDTDDVDDGGTVTRTCVCRPHSPPPTTPNLSTQHLAPPAVTPPTLETTYLTCLDDVISQTFLVGNKVYKHYI